MNKIIFLSLFAAFNFFPIYSMHPSDPLNTFAADAAKQKFDRQKNGLFSSFYKIEANEVTSTILIHLSVHILLDAYKWLTREAGHVIYGASEEDELKKIMIAKEVQSLKEREVALHKVVEDIKKGHFKSYVKTMKTRIAESNSSQEKAALEEDLKTTLEKLSNQVKNNLMRAQTP